MPGPIAEVEGRAFRSFYPRQTRGLITAATTAGLVAWLLPLEGGPRFLAMFLAAMPSLMYGFFRPGGVPAEAWFRIFLAYHLGTRIAVHTRKEARPGG